MYLGKYKPNENEVKIVRQLIDKKIYRQSKQEQEKMLRQTLKDLCNLYGIKEPKLVCDFENKRKYKQTGGGEYYPADKKICLYKMSIVTFLHEFAHHFQHAKKCGNGEEFPRMYSVNVFYAVSPRLFEKAVKNKKIFFI